MCPQLLCASNQQAQALAVAAAAHAAAPADADAAALHALLLEACGRRVPQAGLGHGPGFGASPGAAAASQLHSADAHGLEPGPAAQAGLGSGQGSGPTFGHRSQQEAGDAEATGAYLALLRCDAGSGAALRGLLRVATENPTPMLADVAEGCMLHLDVCMPAMDAAPWAHAAARAAPTRTESVIPDGDQDAPADEEERGAELACTAWRALADSVQQCARDELEARGAGSGAGPPGAKTGAWLRVRDALADRGAWWGGYHFRCANRPSEGPLVDDLSIDAGPCVCAAATQSQPQPVVPIAGPWDPAVLAACAHVAAYVLGPSNAFTSGALAALQGAPSQDPGAGSKAQALVQAIELAGALVAEEGATAGDPGHSTATEAAGGWPGTSCADAVAPGRLYAGRESGAAGGARYGKPSAKYGVVRPLPESWWRVFPQRRRRLRQSA